MPLGKRQAAPTQTATAPSLPPTTIPVTPTVDGPATAQASQQAAPNITVPSTAMPTTAQVSTTDQPKRLGGTREVGDKTMTKDDYWRRKEERDIQKDKDMAWSGIAQAVMDSPNLLQFYTGDNIDGLLTFVADTTDKLLALREPRVHR